jgi:hypothetical protein
MSEAIAVAPYRDASPSAIHPYEGVMKMVLRVPGILAPAVGTFARHIWDMASRAFDNLFRERLMQHRRAAWAQMWEWQARLRQANDDVALVAAIRTVYRKRPERRGMRDQLARAMVQRAVERVAAMVPDTWELQPAR